MTARRSVSSIPQVMGLQGALDEKRGLAQSPGATASFMSLLDKGYSTAIQVLGDSTGNANDEWVYLLGQRLASAYPAYTVRHRLWNDGTQAYDAPTLIQTGTAGTPRGVVLDGSSYLILPSNAERNVSGDLDVRVAVKFTTLAIQTTVIAKSGATRGWYLDIHPTFGLNFNWSVDGTALLGKWSTAQVFTTGVVYWLRVTFVPATGQVTFYTSPDNGATWSVLGTPPAAAGATSIFASAMNPMLGSRGGASVIGHVIECDIRSGINGISVVPRMPESWYQNNTGVITYSGAPVIDFVNGSMAGGGITSYFDVNAARRGAMMPQRGQSLVMLSTAHNDSNGGGADYLGIYAAWLTNIRARYPNIAIVALSQNPKTAPTKLAEQVNHAARCARLASFSAAQGLGFVDVYRAFMESGAALSTLVNTGDGTHPLAAGSVIWAETVYKTFQQRA